MATASFSVGGTPTSVDSNLDTVTVAEVVDVDVTLQTAAPVPVQPGDADRVLTYLVTNTGNGVDDFALVADSALSGDDFDPTLVGIFLDSDGDGVYTAGSDAAYSPGVNDPVLDANDPSADSIVVFVLNDIPGGASDGQLGDSRLDATSNTGSGAPGTTFAGAGDGGVDAVVGAGGADDGDVGSYLVSTAIVSLVKSHGVSDPFGGSQPMPGATITWSIDVTVTGSGTASSLVVHDPIPADTTYVADSITLDGAPQTDADDPPTDGSDFDVTFPGEISVSLGDVAGGSPTRTITFDVTID